MARTSRVIALALTVAGAAGFLFPAAPRARAGVARRGASEDASCQLETELGVMAANNAFYDAFRDGDSAAMERAWHPSEGECSLIVPGERPIIGRASVLGKWDEVLGNTARITPSDVTMVCAASELAWVTCMTSMRASPVAAAGGGDGADDPFQAEVNVWTKDGGQSMEDFRKAHFAEQAAPAAAEEDDAANVEARARSLRAPRARAPSNPLRAPSETSALCVWTARALSARAPCARHRADARRGDQRIQARRDRRVEDGHAPSRPRAELVAGRDTPLPPARSANPGGAG